MAETALNLPSSTYSEAFQRIYGSLPTRTITPTEITLDQKTRESIAADVSAYLRPYYDMAADERQKTAIQSRAELDADAYSRGMGSSTWLTDKKSRESMAAASDIASINAQYGAALSQGVSEQMGTYEQNKLAVAQQNAANRLSADALNAEEELNRYKLAYQMLLDQISLGTLSSGTGSGSGGGTDGDGIFTGNVDYESAIATLKALGVGTKTGVDYLLAGTVPSSSGATTQTPDNTWLERVLNA